jgi:vancomycin permeability regulator SanA
VVLKKLAKWVLLVLAVLLLAAGLVAACVYSYANESSDASADAAVVLGAAVWGAEVSPVFRERINHGVDLYRKGPQAHLYRRAG